MPRGSHYTGDYRIQIALYVSLRFATNQETPILDHAQQEAPGRRPPPSIRTDHVEDSHIYCSYLRIDVSRNTLFIFVKYIPRRSSPPRGEARSTGNHERAPAVMIYRGTLRRAGARTHTRAVAAVAIVPARLVNRHVGGYLSTGFAGLITFFFTPARKKLAWRQCRSGITRVSDLKGHPSSRRYIRFTPQRLILS